MGGFGGDVSYLVVLFWVVRGACGVGAMGREGYGESRILVLFPLLMSTYSADGFFTILVF